MKGLDFLVESYIISMMWVYNWTSSIIGNIACGIKANSR